MTTPSETGAPAPQQPRHPRPAAGWSREKVASAVSWFWREALGLRGSAFLLVLPSCLIFTGWALAVALLDERVKDLALEVGPHEVAGALLGLILVMRTNMGYDRWWEARKLWGGIVNQSRNLVIAALAYGPAERAWRERLVRLTAAFAHACRLSLRCERDDGSLATLLGPEEGARVEAAQHMPGRIALWLAAHLRAGAERGLDRFAFLKLEEERARLIDHVGGCERILKTPMPKSYSLKIRGFILLYLGTLPFAMVDKLGMFTPLLVFIVSYPVLALDQAGIELQNPFVLSRISHLPLDEITTNLERDLLALPEETTGAAG